MNYGKQGVKQRQQSLNAKGPKWSRKFILLFVKALFVCVIGLCIIVAGAGIGVFKGVLDTSPDISKITVTPTGESTFLYDNQGNQIAKLVTANSNRVPVSYEQIPLNLQHAFVAVEDERFYSHNGIDIKGIIRAGVTFVQSGFKRKEGASTLTQQLLKNNVFTTWTEEDSDIEMIRRKIQEQYLAVQLEKVMSKEDIITNYLNTINLGQNTLGVQAASMRYFGKSCSELTLSECAVIASITQNPSKYNPISHPDYNAERRTKVLKYMLEQGYITQEEHDEAINDDVYSRIQTVNEEHAENSVNSYFVDAVTEEAIKDLKEAGYSDSQVYSLLYSGGLKIYTTMDPEIQAICDEEFADETNYPENTKWLLDYQLTTQKPDGSFVNFSSEMMKSYFLKQNARFNLLFNSKEDADVAIEEYKASVLEDGDEVFGENINLTPQPQISFTVSDQTNGHVVAMIGGRGTKEGSRTWNRATQTVRQPGSCFKVLSAFAPAIDSAGMTLATVYNDAPFNYINGTPVTNWYGDDTYKGLCSIRYGVYYSLNIVAVKTLTQITPQVGFDYVKNFGISTVYDSKMIGDQIFTDITQALALGGITAGVKNIELNAAYAAIANHGVYVEPILYTKIVDSDNNVIIDHSTPVARQVIKETTAFLMTDAMVDCVNIGTGTRAKFNGMAIAGKTGTTSDSIDVWFAGYTPYYTATAWAGYDNNVEMSTKEQRIAQDLWKSVMERVHENLENPGFPVPDGIVQCTICSKSGKLPIQGLCDACLRTEYFTEDTVPTEACNVHFSGNICAYDNRPATEQCPFQYQGTIEMIPPEDPSLWSGSNPLDSALDPLATGDAIPNTNNLCSHNEAFFVQPGWEAIVEQQRAEIQQRAGIVPPPPAE